MPSAAPASLARSAVLPRGARVNDRGRLEVGGCDVAEIARELGTPAYVYVVVRRETYDDLMGRDA